MGNNWHGVPPIHRFIRDVIVTDTCWEWAGRKRPNGYGIFSLNGHPHSAHRYSYETFIGPISEGLFVCHSCDNPACVYPGHLWLGTHTDNMQDMWAKGRGHPLLGEEAPPSVLSNEIVLRIRELYADGTPATALAAMFGVKKRCIFKITRGETWPHVGGPIQPQKTLRRLTFDEVAEIHVLRQEGWQLLAIAAKLGISESQTIRILKGRSRKSQLPAMVSSRDQIGMTLGAEEGGEIYS